MARAAGKKCVVEVYDWELDVALAEMHREYGLTASAGFRYAAAVDRSARAGIDQPSRAATLQRLALVKHDRGDRASAMSFLDDALALVENGSDVDYVRVRAGVHATRGQVARDLGDLRTAERAAQRAAELYARIDDVSGGARMLVDLAVVLKDTDRITPARTVARLALALARSVTRTTSPVTPWSCSGWCTSCRGSGGPLFVPTPSRWACSPDRGSTVPPLWPHTTPLWWS